jgi:hypothetical protein
MEETTPPSDYTKGFNEGYTIAQHLPDLAEEMLKAVSDSMRGIGFSHGRDQFIREQNRERRPDWLSGLSEGPDGYFDHNIDKDKGRDIEPER